MTISEYLRSMTNAELIEQFKWFHGQEDDGWSSMSACVTPFGTLTKHMIDKEMERRASSPETV